jgi:hypothetical protein
VQAQSDTHVGASSVETVDAGVGAPSDTHVGASSVETVADAMAPDELSVAHAKRAFIDAAPGPSGYDASIAAPRRTNRRC